MSLIAEGLAYETAGRRLLDGVSLELRPGELLAVLGPNGAGKTTLLKLLSGELEPSAGSVRLNGRPLRAWSRLQVAQQRAVLPQQGGLSFPFTAEEVVRMGCAPHRVRGAMSEAEVVRDAMRVADVLHLAERRYPALSGGERQRVQLARVLAQIWEPGDEEARFLLLDEPTSALDLAHQHQVLGLARQLADAQAIGVLAILHDLNLAACYAERILLLSEGRVAACGPAAEILDARTLEAVFKLPLRVTPHPFVAGAKLVLSGPMSSNARRSAGDPLAAGANAPQATGHGPRRPSYSMSGALP
jgi:iron complex transport system ATP-binding protein